MKYQGYKNRSTWLVVLHLNNTTKEITDAVIRIVNESEEKNGQGRMTRALKERLLVSLLKDTRIKDEEGYKLEDVNFEEIFEVFQA